MPQNPNVQISKSSKMVNNFLNNTGMNNVFNLPPSNAPIYINNNNLMFNPLVNWQNPLNMMQPSNINFFAKNTSLTRVLQCLCEIFKNELASNNTRFIINEMKKYKRNLSVIVDVINIFDFIIQNPQQLVNFFRIQINNFRLNLSMKSQYFQGIKEISPKFAFHVLF